MILDELISNSPNLDKLCNDVSEIQRLTRSGNKGRGHEKEVNLSSVDGEGTFFVGNALIAEKSVGTGPKSAEVQRGLAR